MRNLAIALFLALILSIPSHASYNSCNTTVSYYSQVVTAIDPDNHTCQTSSDEYGDLVIDVMDDYPTAKMYAVSEPKYASYNDVVAYVGPQTVSDKKVSVIVKTGIFAQTGMKYFNQTTASCVKVVKDCYNNVSKKVVKQVSAYGVVNDSYAAKVKAAVSNCK